jgi:predicted DNA-binding transcriptional regulator YafY
MRDDTLVVGFSKRTLQRDIKEIKNVFGIDIEHSKQQKGYYIVQSEMENMNFQRMIEAFDMFNSLNLAQDMIPFIHLEKRRPQGTENLYGLLHAIKNHLEIRFTYQKFWDDKPTKRLVAPYALKEFKNRWYILAKDNKDEQIKSFALDRLSLLEITNAKFKFPDNYNPENIYRNSFGIISPNGETPKEILLSFDPHQGKYIRTLPLHESQKIIKDDDEELQVSLKLHITHDLVMELLSFGDNMKVLKPESLIDEIRKAHQKAYSQY